MFKALADPTRRELLDELFRADGQTLSALEERFAMTRFGVMKHLRQLEEAGLIVTRQARPGEAPLPQPGADPAHPRPMGEQVRRALGRRAQRDQAEAGETDGEGLRDLHPHDPGATAGRRSPTPRSGAKYNFGAGASSDWTPGSRLEIRPRRQRRPLLGEGEVLEVDPPAQARAHHDRAVERRGQERGRQPGHLGDRAGRATRAG